MTTIQPYLGERKVRLIIDALRSSKGDRGATSEERQLAAELERRWQEEVDRERRQLQAQAEEAAAREQRARNHVLTEKQAHALAAVRAGKTPFYRWGDWLGSGHWLSVKNTGGAARRMVAFMVEEGLLEDRTWKLTEQGGIRLGVYEQRHGKIGVSEPAAK